MLYIDRNWACMTQPTTTWAIYSKFNCKIIHLFCAIIIAVCSTINGSYISWNRLVHSDITCSKRMFLRSLIYCMLCMLYMWNTRNTIIISRYFNLFIPHPFELICCRFHIEFQLHIAVCFIVQFEAQLSLSVSGVHKKGAWLGH